jgi:F0F1-type ATP synthase membrane subunit c/vacuolar-type H+-ATPase subunit K
VPLSDGSQPDYMPSSKWSSGMSMWSFSAEYYQAITESIKIHLLQYKFYIFVALYEGLIILVLYTAFCMHLHIPTAYWW